MASTSTAAPPRQGRDANRGPRMFAGGTEQGADEIGGAVDDLRDLTVVRGRVDEAADAQAAADPIERAANLLQGREQVQRADAGGRDARIEVMLDADLAAIEHRAVPFADLPGEKHEVAMPAVRQEMGDRRRHVGQFEAEVAETLLGRTGEGWGGHGLKLLAGSSAATKTAAVRRTKAYRTSPVSRTGRRPPSSA